MSTKQCQDEELEYSVLDWRLDKVAQAYVEDRFASIEEFENAVDHVLAGGMITKQGLPAE